jgi:PST family polysaccharide transporter
MQLKNNKFLKSLSSLFSLQIVTMAIPVLLIPFLARVLGQDGLGVLAFYQAIAAYVFIIVEFGCDFSGTRFVAKK